MEYQDFVLLLDRAPEGRGFVARVVRSPVGEAEAPFTNPVTPEELQVLWRTALESRHRGARDLGPTPVTTGKDPLAAELSLEKMGDRLFQALFQGPVRSCWVRSLAELAREPEAGLRLKLQLNLTDPVLASLAELPWEYLFSQEHGGFLALQRNTPILRHMPLPLTGGKPPVARPLRVLIVSSQPRTMPSLALQDEGERIATVLRASGIETLSLHNVALETLRDTLLQQRFHVLHLMGHGGFDPASGQGVLYFSGQRGEPAPIGGALLASHLSGLPYLRLVFVNACETARANARAPFAGVATALLRVGVPAVVAMQRPIQDDSALEFSRVVYRRLAVGDPIDAAVTEGRLAITRGRGALLEWGTPVLFLRDGRLFADEPATVAAEAPLSAPVRPRRVLYPLVATGALALGISVVAPRWSSVPEGITESPLVSESGSGTLNDITSEVAESPVALEPEERSEPPKSEVKKKDEPKGATPSEPDTEPARPEAPKTVSSYEVSEGSPVNVPGLDAEIGVRFFDRDGFTLAHFSLTPPGQGMLQQPPVLGRGAIKFPAANGIYHLDVLDLDLEQRRATVRLRLSSEASMPAGPLS